MTQPQEREKQLRTFYEAPDDRPLGPAVEKDLLLYEKSLHSGTGKVGFDTVEDLAGQPGRVGTALSCPRGNGINSVGTKSVLPYPAFARRFTIMARERCASYASASYRAWLTHRNGTVTLLTVWAV